MTLSVSRSSEYRPEPIVDIQRFPSASSAMSVTVPICSPKPESKSTGRQTPEDGENFASPPPKRPIQKVPRESRNIAEMFSGTDEAEVPGRKCSDEELSSETAYIPSPSVPTYRRPSVWRSIDVTTFSPMKSEARDLCPI